MKFKQFYLGCLAHASYYIGSETEAAIIDPQRDVQQYLDEAAANGQRIKYIIETHSHADFVSGHLELSEKTGAEIVYGTRAKTEFPTHKVKDGDVLSVGKVNLKFLETPGHTPDGITVLAENTEDSSEPLKMFTGDTLFVGDVGRPDLVGSRGFNAEQMGAMLYDSIHEKILPLPDETEVYPAHGAGSLCGKSLSKETWSTLGVQRKMNYALQPMTKEEEENYEKRESFLKTASKNHAISKLCTKYRKIVLPFTKKSDDMTDKTRELVNHLHLGIKTEEEVVHTVAGIGDCFEIIQWYLFFIDAKFQRALHGKMEGEEWEVDNGYQKDSEGSAKIALIAIEKSMAAWIRMIELMPASEDVALNALSTLSQVKQKGLEEFPKAMDFKRPGFDE